MRKIIKIFTFSIRKANYNTFRINWMPEGPVNVKNNQNLFFFKFERQITDLRREVENLYF